MPSEIQLLQAIRLKGRPTGSDVASAAGVDEATVVPALRTLVGARRCARVEGRYRLTPAGRERLTRLIADERAGVDQRALADAYDRFDPHNAALKSIVTDWQLKDGAPNDHTDAGYDAWVIGRLADLHDRFRPLLTELVAIAPRLAPYPARLAAALEKVVAGEHRWLARPMIDSYHTVWFELHEDLIGLSGRTRQIEAAAGRAE